MALFKRYVSQFDEIEPSEALENYCVLAGYKKNTNRISLSKLKELLNSNLLIVTARYKDGVYSPDRRFDEVKECYLNGIFPILRVINGNDNTTYYLKSYNGTTFVFECNSSVSVTENKVVVVDTFRFSYSQNAFEYSTESIEIPQVDVKYTELN